MLFLIKAFPYKIRKHFISLFLFLLFWPSYGSSSNDLSNIQRFNPSIAFNTYLGGNNNESSYAIAIDSQNNIFITGETNSTTFDSLPVSQGKFQFNQNCFVVKISATTPLEDFYFEFSGSQRETCREIAIDKQDNIYLTGETQSNDLPMTTNRVFSGEWDAFLLKLSNTGKLLYASYVGGNLTDYGHGLVIESVDNIYMTGETWSTNFPTTSNAFMSDCKLFTSCDDDKNKSKSNIFLTHINTQNPAVFNSQYSTYLGGSNHDKAHDLAIDNNRHLHIVGETRSQDFPLVNKFIANIDSNNLNPNNLSANNGASGNQTLNGTYDAFLAVINPHISTIAEPANTLASKSLVLSTYIGGSKNDFAFSVTTDNEGTSYITGETWSDDFPITNTAFSKKCATGLLACNQNSAYKNHSDAFIIAIAHDQINHNNTTSYIKYSTYLGGEGTDTAQDIFVDRNVIYITGTTSSNQFPITHNANKPTCHPLKQCNDLNDGFIVAINTDDFEKKGLIYSSYIGGNNKDNINSFSFSAAKNNSEVLTSNWPSNNFSSIFFTGRTDSTDLIKKEAAFALTLDTKIENGEAFIQQFIIKEKGNWLNQYTVPKNGSAINSKNKPKQVMASSIGYILFLYISLACIFLILRKTHHIAYFNSK